MERSAASPAQQHKAGGNNLSVSIVAGDNSTRLEGVSTLRQSAGSRTRRLRWSNRYTKPDLILASSGEEDSL
jgi:hypothetical protein